MMDPIVLTWISAVPFVRDKHTLTYTRITASALTTLKVIYIAFTVLSGRNTRFIG